MFRKVNKSRPMCFCHSSGNSMAKWWIVVTLLSSLTTAVWCRSITSRHEDSLKDCEWQRFTADPEDVLVSEEDDQSPAPLVLACRLRTIGGTDSLLSNLTSAAVDRITALRLVCSDVLFFESTLESSSNKQNGVSFLGQLKRLRDLRIEYCKIRYVPSAVLASSRELRHLSLRTHNTDWSAMTMEFHMDSFRGLSELRSLDLADNNIWALPQELFCPLYSLASLNLSSNRLQDVTELGFSDWGNGPTAPGKSCNVGLEVLDISNNDIIMLPDNGLSSLRSLQKLYLQDNSLTSLADRALVGLGAMQVFNLSNNQLVALPPELFQSTRDLKEIYIQNNSISVLAPGLLEGLDQLQVLDLSGNELTNNYVNRDTFSGLIRLIVLNLSHNSITRVDAHVFQDLYSLQMLNLEYNNIDVISEGAFATLSNLHALTLSHNTLVQIEPYHFTGLYVLNQLYLDNNNLKAIHPRAFENCTNLRDLGLNANSLLEVPDGIGQLRFLKTLDLGENSISKIVNSSFEGLDQLYGLRLIDNAVVNLTRDAFSTLPSLQVLNVACNRIEHVEPGSFGTNPTLRALRLDGNKLVDIMGIFNNLPGLIWLNISDNAIQWFDYALLPRSLEWLDMHKNLVADLGNKYDTRNELQIKMIDVSFNRLIDIGESSLPDSVESVFLNDNMITRVRPNTFSKKGNLSRVVLYANQIQSLDLVALHLEQVPLEKELPQFYIGGNPFHCDCTMEWLQRINQLSHLRQYPRVLDLDTVMCSLAHSRDGNKKPLLDLKPSQFLCPYDFHCFALCHCCDFDACDCEMTCPENCTCYHDHTWTANVVDCSNSGYTTVPAKIPMDATEIYLDGNTLGELGSHVFIGKKKLEVLYLNSSNIATIHNRTFNGVSSLRVLHLENNKLQELRGFEFDQLENLNELYLDHNLIAHVGNTTFSAMSALEVLHLDDNKIVNFAPWQLSAASRTLSQVTFNGNSWTCECDSLTRFESWVRENKDKVTITDPNKMSCTYSNGVKENLGEAIRKCPKDANSNAVATSVVQNSPFFNNALSGNYVPLLAASLAVVLILFVLSALVFIFRQDVRLWAHSRYGVRIFWDATQANDPDDDRDRLYDAYMVYSLKDDDFVSRVIASELEQSGYSMCLHYRDLHLMTGASYLADSVLGATDASRRLIIVLSLSFLQNEWNKPEFRAALQAALQQSRLTIRRNKILFLLTTDIRTLNLDPDLHLLLQTCTSIAWGSKRFWEKLRYSMPDIAQVKKKKKRNAKSTTTTTVAVNDLKKLDSKSAAKPLSARYTAAPSSLDAWCKYAAMAPSHPQAPSAPLPTPTPTQSTYVSENSSQRTTDHEEEEEESSSTTTGSQHYDYSAAIDRHKLNYMAIDARQQQPLPPQSHQHYHQHHRNNLRDPLKDLATSTNHLYSTIQDGHLHSNAEATELSYPTAANCRMTSIPSSNGVLPQAANGRTYFV